MTDQQQPPQTIVQAGGRVAEGLVSSFTGAPTLLLIVILNITMIIMGGFFLLKQDELQAKNVAEVISLVRACILETVPTTHLNRELDNNGP